MSMRRVAVGLVAGFGGVGLMLPLAGSWALVREARAAEAARPSGFVEVGVEPLRWPSPDAVIAPAPKELHEAPRVLPAPSATEPTATASAPAIEPPEPTRTGSLGDLVLPAPPAASVVIGDAEAVAGAIEVRLADAKSVWLPRTSRKDRDAIAAFYAGSANRPIWVQSGAWSAPARALIDRLGRADEDGLDAADYPVPVVGTGSGRAAPLDLAEADLKLSVAAALYARDARGGRIDPTRLSALITPKLDLPAGDAVLGELARSPDPGAALAGYNPTYPGYRALRDKLAEARARLPAGQPMARRMHRPLLTTQSIATLDDVPAIRPDAWSNPRLEGDIVANMERWRWLPRETGSRYVFVNIPEFRLRIMEGGRAVHETRVITGKPDSPTPIFSGIVEYAVVNPSWYLPPSILKKEFLPKLAADPTYAARLGYDVVRRGNTISIRQPPGEKNALGFIKFMFPNQHAVYLHDTPNRNLFSASRRAFSHGCVRVDQPFELADMLLGSAWSEARLRKLIGHGERTIFLPQKIPVHLAYFTTSVDEMGELRSYEDIYGVNRKVRMALGLGA